MVDLAEGEVVAQGRRVQPEEADELDSPSAGAVARTRPPGWRATYGYAALVIDFAAAAIAFTAAAFMRFGMSVDVQAVHEPSLSYRLFVLLLAPLWMMVMAFSGAYETKDIGSGTDEYRRIVNAAVRYVALIATISFALNVDLARGLLAIAVPLAFLGSVVGRRQIRRFMIRRRHDGRYIDSLLIVGSARAASNLIRHLRGSPDAGFKVVGALLAEQHLALEVDGEVVPVLGDPSDVYGAVATTPADAVAIVDGAGLPDGALRELAWRLEHTGVDLLVAPAMTEVAGPRVGVRPISGLPLLHVEEPEFDGVNRIVKEVFDRSVAIVGLAALTPALLAIAVMIKATSKGPVFFRQVRLGLDGRSFTVWKFRSMKTGADAEVASLAARNDSSGLLFKMRDDPRVTAVGRWLRRFSIDEIPQLINVARGEMSLVGPRPLPISQSDVDEAGSEVARRHLVKPGLTGLWQVSGRSELAWEDSVRLDLYYIENWSLALDAWILFRTARVVLFGTGAY